MEARIFLRFNAKHQFQNGTRSSKLSIWELKVYCKSHSMYILTINHELLLAYSIVLNACLHASRSLCLSLSLHSTW